MTKEEIVVFITIEGEGVDLGSLSETLGISPSRQWKKGQARSGSVRAISDGWRLETGLPRSAALSDHLSALGQFIRSNETELLAIAKVHKIYVSVVIYGYANTCFLLPPDFLKSLASVNAGINIDVYHTIDDDG